MSWGCSCRPGERSSCFFYLCGRRVGCGAGGEGRVRGMLFVAAVLLALFTLSVHTRRGPQGEPSMSTRFRAISNRDVDLGNVKLTCDCRCTFTPGKAVVFDTKSSCTFKEVLRLGVRSLHRFRVSAGSCRLMAKSLTVRPHFCCGLGGERHGNGHA